MSWNAVNPSYRALPVFGQIQNLSKGMGFWICEFKLGLHPRVQGTFSVSIQFTEKDGPKVKNQTTIDKYRVVNGENTEKILGSLIAKVKELALGNQNSFGIFVRMEDLEPSDWAAIIEEDFLGCVVQEKDEYTRKKMVKELGLIDNESEMLTSDS